MAAPTGGENGAGSPRRLSREAGAEEPSELRAVGESLLHRTTLLNQAHVFFFVCFFPSSASTLRVSLQEDLRGINATLSSEYECRRRMLIKRLDVTVQSFGWSDRAKVTRAHASTVDRSASATPLPDNHCVYNVLLVL